MKPKSNILPIILIIGLLIGVVYFTTDYFALSGTPVNIHFGDVPLTNPYDTTGRYYIADFNVVGDSAGLVFVPYGLNYNDDRLELKISSTSSTYKAPITIPPTYLQYRNVEYALGIPGFDWDDVDYRDVSLESPFLYTKSNVQLSTPGNNIKTTNVIQEGIINNVGETVTRFIVTHAGVDRTIYMRFDNLVFKSGDLPIAGDYVIFKDYIGNERFVRYDHLTDATGGSESLGECYESVSTWNCYVWNEYSRLRFSNVDEYDDYCDWLYSNNKIPDKCPPTADSCSFVSNQLLIDYPSTVFTQRVTVYVPEELAEFIMLAEQTPEFRFNPIPDIDGNEGQLILVNVKGTAISSGTINLRIEGAGLESVNWVDSTQQTLVAGKSYTFPVYVKLSQVGSASKLPITVYSQPSANMGVPTDVTFYANIADTSTVDKYDLRVQCIDTNDKIVENAEIYIDNEFVGYGDVTQNIVKGNHYVYAENVTGWYSGYPPGSQKFVNLITDQTVIIEFTEEPPKEGYPLWAYIIFSILGVVALLFIVLILKEAGIDITVSHLLILLAIIVFAGLMWYGFSLLERLIEALEKFKLFGS